MSAIDGMSKQKAKDVVQKVMNRYGKGIFRDQYWSGAKNILKAFNKAEIDYNIESTKYGVSPNARKMWIGPMKDLLDDYKEWILSFTFTDDKGKQMKIGAKVTAHGAGSVESPLDKYDISAYVF